MKNIKFRYTKNKFQSQLKKDKQKIEDSTNVLVFADKTSNIYELKPSYKWTLKIFTPQSQKEFWIKP